MNYIDYESFQSDNFNPNLIKNPHKYILGTLVNSMILSLALF